MDNFTAALEHVFEVEGGYSNHPEDKGGETRFGITKKTYERWVSTYSDLKNRPPIKLITKGTAAVIYKELYWEKIRGDELPTGLSLMVFDSAVHAGPVAATRWLQGAVGEKTDGILGPKTLAAALNVCQSQILERIAVYRLMMARSNETFVMGWFNRIVHTLTASMKLI